MTRARTLLLFSKVSLLPPKNLTFLSSPDLTATWSPPREYVKFNAAEAISSSSLKTRESLPIPILKVITSSNSFDISLNVSNIANLFSTCLR